MGTLKTIPTKLNQSVTEFTPETTSVDTTVAGLKQSIFLAVELMKLFDLGYDTARTAYTLAGKVDLLSEAFPDDQQVVKYYSIASRLLVFAGAVNNSTNMEPMKTNLKSTLQAPDGVSKTGKALDNSGLILTDENTVKTVRDMSAARIAACRNGTADVTTLQPVNKLITTVDRLVQADLSNRVPSAVNRIPGAHVGVSQRDFRAVMDSESLWNQAMQKDQFLTDVWDNMGLWETLVKADSDRVIHYAVSAYRRIPRIKEVFKKPIKSITATGHLPVYTVCDMAYHVNMYDTEHDALNKDAMFTTARFVSTSNARLSHYKKNDVEQSSVEEHFDVWGTNDPDRQFISLFTVDPYDARDSTGLILGAKYGTLYNGNGVYDKVESMFSRGVLPVTTESLLFRNIREVPGSVYGLCFPDKTRDSFKIPLGVLNGYMMRYVTDIVPTNTLIVPILNTNSGLLFTIPLTSAFCYFTSNVRLYR